MAETVPAEQGQEQQQPQRSSGWQTMKTIAFQMLLFYLITSYFRGGSKEPVKGPDGEVVTPAMNIFSPGDEMVLSVFFSEDEFNYSMAIRAWSVDLIYGDWGGESGDSSITKDINVPIPKGVQENGTWYIHLVLVESGHSIDEDDEYYDSNLVVHKVKMFNKFKKRRIHNTVNLLTGQADVAPGEQVSETSSVIEPEIISYWHPNVTINIVYDESRYMIGGVPEPLDKFIEFTENGTGYYPILYHNDYWNLAQDYTPLNDTLQSVTIHFTYIPLTFFRFQLYASVMRENPWGQWMGAPDPNDDDQDTVKQTLLETNPYLLGLTVIVSIVHSVFEFLAFKNDVQFWKSRKSLEGLSVQSVFFNVFQSLIVLLYIIDNETNFVVIVSVFIGLLIEMWKVTKVVIIKIDREDLIAGIIPKIKITDKPSYVQSSTKVYDKLAFKYLGCILFPLFVGYGVYSLIYHEHKGWYSFILSMSYGFLLTFGFITMTPQLFINYKLKSVAHLPWRMLTYKALNTFIDDMFAFVIKMPMMYRIGCFRDDIVFFIFLYQRWIYRVDPKRVNEFGTTGEDHVSTSNSSEPGNNNNSITDGNSDETTVDTQESLVNDSDTVKTENEKKND